MASGSEDRTVRIWDLASGQERNQLPYLSPVHSVSFSSDGKTLASGSVDGIVLWELGSAEAPDTLKHTGAVMSVVFSRDGQTLISAGDHPTRFWDMATGKEKGTLPGPIWSGAISQDGTTLAALTPDKTIQVWDLTTKQAKARIQKEKAAEGALSPDGATLATFHPFSDPISPSASKTVELWNTTTGQLRTSFQVRDLSVISVAFSPDGKILATGEQLYAVGLWDAATGRQKLTFNQGESGFSAVFSLRFSPDGKTLAIGNDRGTVRLRDVATGQLLAALKGHTQRINSLAFSPDGKTLATASDTVKLWDTATGQERMTLKTGAVTCVAFAADGKTLATASRDGTVKLWRGAADQEATAFRNELDPDDPDSARATNNLGDRLLEIHRPREAENAYRKALARLEKLAGALPDTADYQAELAYCMVALRLMTDSQTAAAPSDRQFAEIWRTLPADRRSRLSDRLHQLGHTHEQSGQPGNAIGAFSRSIELAPENLQLHICRGRAYVQMNEWQKAAEDFEVGLQLSNADGWYRYSLLRLQLGQKDNYQIASTQMLDRFGQSASADDAYWIVWTCVLGPGAVADWTKLLTLAEKAHAHDRKNYDVLNHLGAVLYRAGRFKEAAQRLTEAEAAFKQTPSMPSTIAYNWFFQAMVQHCLGNTAEAASWLKKAVQDIDEPKTAQDPAQNTWDRRLTLQLLRREAEELLKKEPEKKPN